MRQTTGGIVPAPAPLAAVAMRADSAPGAAPDEGWLVVVTGGPNKGAVVPLGQGAFRFGAGLSNDVVLADPAMADEQAVLSFDAHGARVAPLAAGVRVDGKPVAPGRALPVADGALVQAGETVLQLRGPPRPRRRRGGWLLVAVPLVLVGVGGSALVGFASPSRGGGVAAHTAPVAAPSANPASEAAASSLRERLQQVGLAEQIGVTAVPGAVVAEGHLSGPDLARWAEHQLWFDGRFKGNLSLVNRVREAPAGERPNLHLRAVATGKVPYLIVANGDRYVEGAVVDGWTVERITPEKVVLSRNGRRVELAL